MRIVCSGVHALYGQANKHLLCLFRYRIVAYAEAEGVNIASSYILASESLQLLTLRALQEFVQQSNSLPSPELELENTQLIF